MTVKANLRQSRQPFYQLIPENSQTAASLRLFCHCQLHCPGKTHDPSNVFGPRTQVAFLGAAIRDVGKPCSLFDIKKANPLWSVKFVSGSRKQIHLQLFNIHRYIAQGLNCICMKKRSPLMGNNCQLPNRLNGAYFIIGMHNRNQDCLIADSLSQLGGRDHSVFIHRQHRQPIPSTFQGLTGIENGMVFDCRGDNMPAFIFFLSGGA